MKTILTIAVVATTFVRILAAQEMPHDLSLVLLIGQSNMAGRGEITAADQRPIPGVYMLNQDRQWVPAVDPMHWDKPQAGVGLGRTFARTLIEARPGAKIGLIPAAVGNTSLSKWAPGGELYAEALSRIREAQKSGKLIAILWHQGEADSGKVDTALSYAQRWVAMMKQLRKDVGAPDVPIIAGELGRYLYHRSNGRSKYSQTVNVQIDSLSQKLNQVGVATSENLTHLGDEVHFNTESLHNFGQRYAIAFLKLQPSWQTVSSAVPQKKVLPVPRPNNTP